MKNVRWIKFLLAFLMSMAGLLLWRNAAVDNDSWFVIAEGREIVENGIYYTDQLSMHEDLVVTVQNYGFSVIFYLIYTAFGPVGLHLSMLALNMVICVILYKICMLISHKNENLSLLLMILTDLLLGMWFVVTRAQVVSYTIELLVIYILELYVKEKRTKALWWLPVLSMVQINLHASLWPIILLIMGTYIVDSCGGKELHLGKIQINLKRLHLQGYKTWPLVKIFIISILAGFINPYGIKAVTYDLTSYGVAEANMVISEMLPFSFSWLGGGAILLYLVLVGTIFIYIFSKKRKPRMRYLMMLFGFLALGINNRRGMSHLILVLLWPLAEVCRDFRIERIGNRKVRWMTLSWCGILAVAVIGAALVLGLPEVARSAEKVEIAKAMDIIDTEVGERDKKSLKIYVDYDNGGYVEYRGYKAYLDSRMETFIKANNGKEDIFQEWYRLENGEIKEAEFLEKYDFDYIIAREHAALYEVANDKYEMILEYYTGEDEGNNRGNQSALQFSDNRGEENYNRGDDKENTEKRGIRVYKKVKM